MQWTLHVGEELGNKFMFKNCKELLACYLFASNQLVFQQAGESFPLTRPHDI